MEKIYFDIGKKYIEIYKNILKYLKCALKLYNLLGFVSYPPHTRMDTRFNFKNLNVCTKHEIHNEHMK